MRIKFKKGQQRKFLQDVLKKINCPSLRELRQRGFDISYSCLKNYYLEYRLMPEEFVKDLCRISGISFSKMNFELIDEHWGQVKGGKNGKRR